MSSILKYRHLERGIIMIDLYYEKEYAKLYEKIEGGKCEEFIYSSELGTVRHLFIKKPAPITIHGETYYDLVTPYGYGGPIITHCTDESRRTELARQFRESFKKFCQENNIVSEFVRFHPVLLNARDFRDMYDVDLKRKTTGTNLASFTDPAHSEVSKSARRNIRKALDAGVTFKVTPNPQSLKNFKEIYHATMKRNNAEPIYFFSDEYFSACLEHLGKYIVLTEVMYEERIIGMGLNFAYNGTIHSHLSGTLQEYQHMSTAYVMQYAIIKWGKENGFNILHDGGGRTSLPDDKLYLFKKQFGKHTEFDFYVGYKIWNEGIYEDLCIAAGAKDSTGTFPTYRQEINTETETQTSTS